MTRAVTLLGYTYPILIPKELFMMGLQFTPFIMLDGYAKEAIRFYEEALGAKVVFLKTMGEAPEGVEAPSTEEGKARIAHDVLPGQIVQPGNLVNICITVDDAETTARYYEALKQGGEVQIPLGSVYFSPAYGMVKDKFGVVFQLFTRRPAG
jgi:PhnB protein